jgi:hypothetical protein
MLGLKWGDIARIVTAVKEGKVTEFQEYKQNTQVPASIIKCSK